MHTLMDAAKELLKAGWSTTDINNVLGISPEPAQTLTAAPKTPWWSWVGEEWYTGGTPLDADWEAWLSANTS
jgi:hypothetical protein